MNRHHAAIDIGTTSIHLVIARINDEGIGFDVVTSEKAMVRLGEGSQKNRRLSDAAIERSVAALARMVKVAQSYDASVSAVATSAVREAENGKDFVQQVQEEVGVEVEVIAGTEEARLIHLGVLQALPVFDKRHLVVDIGGGSTEFVVGQEGSPIEVRSAKIGAIRLTDSYFDADEVSSKRVKKCRNHIQNILADVFYELKGHRPEVAIGSSGTTETMAAIIAGARGEVPRNMNGFEFTAEELTAAVDLVVSTPRSKRKKIPGLDSRRVDIIVGGALLLEGIFSGFGLSSMTISEYALREGVLYDRAGRDAGSEHLKDLRRSNARRLALSLDPDANHAETTARLALQIFDRTVDVHGFGSHDRELLEIAAIVHNVGLFISHAGHHKHTAYIVRSCEDLTGFTQHERELVALIARYHRKSHPTLKHQDFANLTEEDKRRVSVLAGLLRIAIGLDRRHAASVSTVRVNHDADDGSLMISPVPHEGFEVSLEVYAASERASLLSSALGVPVSVEEASG